MARDKKTRKHDNYSRDAYLASIENTPRSFFYEMQALAQVLIYLHKQDLIPKKSKWPHHLQQFADFEATTEFLDRAYRDLFPEFLRRCPDKAAFTIAGYTLTPEGIVNTLHLRRRGRED